MNKLWAFLFLLILFISTSALAREAVGIVSYLRGSAFANNEKIELNQEIYVDDKIKTEKKSVVKITLIDESTIIVAPSSTINIDEIETTSKASLISVLKGSLRAVVPKKIKKEKLNKLVIKSPMAAFGVRGTDFIVGHSKVNSHIITFSGLVKIAPLNSFDRSLTGINKELEKNGRLVSKGEFSSLTRGSKNFSPPIKINRNQFFALRRNQNFIFKKEIKNIQKRNIYPKNFPKKRLPKTNKIDLKNNEILPGGYVELNTGTYIAPDPETSNYDSVNELFIPNEKQGSINKKSGEYTPPENYEFTEDGKVKINIKEKNKKINEPKKQDNKTKGKKLKKGSPSLPLPIQQNSAPPVNLFLNQQQNNNQEFSIPSTTNVRIRIRNE